MGKALELITVRATAPSTGAAFAAISGNSLTVRNSRGTARILAGWQTAQTAGFRRITSPLLHDGTVGMQMCGGVGATIYPFLGQKVEPQDTLSVYGTGSATAGDMEFASLLIHYPDLAGVDGRFIGVAELERRKESILAVPSTIATPTTGEYGVAEAINAEADQFKANTDYALLGATVQVGAAAIRWVGPDFGGLGVGMPGLKMERADWFVWLSEHYGLPCIPVINSANRAMTMVDAVVDENGTDAIFSTIWARLR